MQFEIFHREGERFIVTGGDTSCDILSELNLNVCRYRSGGVSFWNYFTNFFLFTFFFSVHLIGQVDVIPVRGWAFKMEDTSVVMESIERYNQQLRLVQQQPSNNSNNPQSSHETKQEIL
jgi:hypothetical protein